MPFASIPEALDDFRAGRMLVVVDDEDRENEGDLTVAAERVTPEIINFMATHGRGLICLALSRKLCETLRLAPMSSCNSSRFGTAFTESVDAAEGVTTGISAADRARTIEVCMRPDARPADLARPGHVFPLQAREGGVLVRAGQTEAAVDLAVLAGFRPGGVICEIMNDDGTMARVPQLEDFCARHAIRMVSVADLIRHRLRQERFIRRAGERRLRIRHGEFRAVTYLSCADQESHVALVLGEVEGEAPVLVRMHSHCLHGDIFGSLDCDCRRLVEAALERLAREGVGVFVYLHQTGPGMRDHYSTPNGSRIRQYEAGIGAQILADLGLRRVRLLTDHPRKIIGLEGFGIQVVEQLALS